MRDAAIKITPEDAGEPGRRRAVDEQPRGTPPPTDLVPLAEDAGGLSASAVLAEKYPSFFYDSNNARSRVESVAVFSTLALILGVVGAAWWYFDRLNTHFTYSVSYDLGLYGGILMLVALTYAMRKRLRLFRKLGGMSGWYYFHLFGGVVGPVLIIFHSSFSIRSINSLVAFVAMLVVVASGFFGRYLYTRIGYGLHRGLLEIKGIEEEVNSMLRQLHVVISREIEKDLSTFAVDSLMPRSSLLGLVSKKLQIRLAAANCYAANIRELTISMQNTARREGWTKAVFQQRLNSAKRMLKRYVNALTGVAQLHVYEQILVRWRIFHVPLLYILLFTALFHVLAVHMY